MEILVLAAAIVTMASKQVQNIQCNGESFLLLKDCKFWWTAWTYYELSVDGLVNTKSNDLNPNMLLVYTDHD